MKPGTPNRLLLTVFLIVFAAGGALAWVSDLRLIGALILVPSIAALIWVWRPAKPNP